MRVNCPHCLKSFNHYCEETKIQDLDCPSISEVIDFLKNQEPVLEFTLSNPHSYRGFYERLAFVIDDRISDRDETIKLVKSQINTMHTGYKGGEYLMRPDTWVHFVRDAYGVEYKEDQHD